MTMLPNIEEAMEDARNGKLSPYWQNTLRYITFPPFRGIRTHSDPSSAMGNAAAHSRRFF